MDDFNPVYGLGISYNLVGGQLFVGYAFSDDNIAGIKLEQSAFNVGYSLDFLTKRDLTTSSITNIFGTVKEVISLSNRKK